MSAGQIRLDPHRLAIGRDGLVELVLRLEGAAEVVVRVGDAGINLDRAAKRLGGGWRLAAIEQDQAKRVVILECARLDGDGPADEIESARIAAGLVDEIAEKMQCVGFVGMLDEDLPVNGLRFSEPAGAVVLDGQLEAVFGRRSQWPRL